MTALSRRRFVAGAGVLVAGLASCSGREARRRAVAIPSSYGSSPLQGGDLLVPEDTDGSTVVLIHGGFWYPGFGRDLLAALAVDLAERGYVTWNLDYRPAEGGSGWPYLLEDVAAGIDHLVDLAGDHPLDLDRVAVVGHSAGGQLALWSAARSRFGPGRPGADPRVRPRAAVGQAPVADLEAGAAAGLGNRAVQKFLGGEPGEVPDRYAAASPVALVPSGVATLLVHGIEDALVPVDQSRRYATAARAAGDDVELVEIPGADHFAVIDPGHAAWAAVTDRLGDLLA